MPEKDGGFFFNVQNLLQQDYRGVNVRIFHRVPGIRECFLSPDCCLQIAVYALATAGLAISIHKIRPVNTYLSIIG